MANRLIWGLFLIAIGGLLLAVNLGLDVPHGVWNYWPFLLIAMGSVKLLVVRDGDRDGGGVWLILSGLYGWISIWHVWGLNWGTAWPIFVIAGGLSVLFRPKSFDRGRRGDIQSTNGGVDHVG
ncbi:MAG: DUF5668 domain-containing protein [Thermoanaerobaculia bacterium]